MKLYNEKNQLLDSEELVKELMSQAEAVALSEEEIENELENYYQQAKSIEMVSFGLDGQKAQEFALAYAVALPGWGKRLLAKIKQVICKVLDEDSTVKEIIEAILEALAAIIPGGIIIKKIVEKIVRYVINRGIAKLCPVELR